MSPHFRRNFALIAFLCVALVANWSALYAARGRAFLVPAELPLPMELEGWKGTVIPTQDTTKAILPHARIQSVRYEKKGMNAPVDLVLIASRDPNDMHTPERCFTGSGFDLSERASFPLQTAGADADSWSVNRVLARAENMEELVLYLYDGVPKVGGSTVMTRIAMKLRGPYAKPAYFVRVSSPTLGDRAGAETVLKDFLQRLMTNRASWQKPE